MNDCRSFLLGFSGKPKKSSESSSEYILTGAAARRYSIKKLCGGILQINSQEDIRHGG